MARPDSAKGSVAPQSKILPLPSPVIDHHGQTIFEVMKEWRTSKRVPPVLLLTGTAGIGKREIGYFLAQWIFCEKSGLNQAPEEADLFGGTLAQASVSPSSEPPPSNWLPCGICNNCHKALSDTWVDFTEITPESEESDALKIDIFRKIKTSQGFGAHEGLHRIFLIPNADRMTLQAANSMLKLLEEPPRGWTFLLTASDPSLLLPTLISRCQQLRLRPFPHAQLTEVLSLSGLPPDRRRICAELSHGSWGKAILLAEDENWEKRKAIFAFLQDPTLEISGLVDWAALIPSHFEILTNQLESVCDDLIRWSLTGQNPESHAWTNSDGKTTLIQHVHRCVKNRGSISAARDFWIERAERIARARVEAHAPINRKTLIQAILLPWIALNPGVSKK